MVEIQGKGALKAEATGERVLKELPRTGFSDLRRVFDANNRLLRPEGWDGDTAAAVASVEVVTRNIGDGEVEHVHKFKVWDKNSALEMLTKHLGCSSSVSSTLGHESQCLPEDVEL
ncbi:terminase small subunit [Sinorhizobium meliloti]|uniref:terminase small subunit n=1 Tax=Rhizobium meliloti TaxID=382 RepID=UPI00299CEA43